MPELSVPRSDRPSALKYAIFAMAGFVLLGGGVSILVGSLGLPAATMIGWVVGGILNVVLFFVLVQSLIEEWLSAVEVVED